MHKNDISLKSAVFISFVIALIIVGIHLLFSNAILNPRLVIYPREYNSIIGILTANFLHYNNAHLLGNILPWLLIAPFAFYLEGKRTYNALLLSTLLSGVASYFFGKPGVMTIGFSGVVCGVTAVSLMGMLRAHRFWLLPIAFLVFYQLVGEGFLTTFWPSKMATEKHISWLAHLGGFMGGMIAITNSRSRALEILVDTQIISQKEFDKLFKRMENGVDITKIDDTNTISDINTTVPTPQDKPVQKVDDLS